MKLSYDAKIKNIIIDGQGDIIIPKDVCFNIDTTSLKKLEDEFGVHLSVKDFAFNGKPKIKDKLKMIIKIIKIK